jgi:hypothetical protein
MVCETPGFSIGFAGTGAPTVTYGPSTDLEAKLLLGPLGSVS